MLLLSGQTRLQGANAAFVIQSILYDNVAWGGMIWHHQTVFSIVGIIVGILLAAIVDTT